VRFDKEEPDEDVNVRQGAAMRSGFLLEQLFLCRAATISEVNLRAGSLGLMMGK
jgi:hypothetical protein